MILAGARRERKLADAASDAMPARDACRESGTATGRWSSGIRVADRGGCRWRSAGEDARDNSKTATGSPMTMTIMIITITVILQC